MDVVQQSKTEIYLNAISQITNQRCDLEQK